MKASWTESSAFNAVNSWLRLSTSKHEPLVGVAAQNDAMAVGARKALQEFFREFGGLEHLQKLHFFGVDGVPSAGQAWVRASVLSATIVAPPLAGTALDLLTRALRTGEAPPEITFLPPNSFPALSALKPGMSKSAAGGQ